MPMNENTAAFFHHFEPLYQVIDDMPRPPESLLKLREGQWLHSALQLRIDLDRMWEKPVDHPVLILVSFL